MVEHFKTYMAMSFSALFLLFAVALGGLAAWQFVTGLMGEELITGLVRSINTAVIALAIFELGIGIGKEYATPEEGHSIYPVIRRTVTRFVALVSIALVLEGLMMVIKYSQLDLAGNLYYPVAIVASAALLLAALGAFLRLTRAEALEQPEALVVPTPAEEEARRTRGPLGALSS